jgi:hypothetical protein
LSQVKKQFSHGGAKIISTQDGYVSIGCSNAQNFNFCLSVLNKSGDQLRVISHGPKIPNNTYMTDFTVISDLTIDKDNNLVVVGFTSQALAENLADTSSPTSSRGDGFVAKYSLSGNLIWLKQFGAVSKGANASKREEFHAVKTNQNNEIIIAGNTNSNFAETNGGSSDALLLKLSSSGDVLFEKQLGSSSFGSFSNKEEKFLALALDSAGNIVVGGHTNGDLLETNSSKPSCGYPGAVNGDCDWSDIMIFSYTAEGTLRWSKQLGKLSATQQNAASAKFDFLNSIELDDAGNIYFTGHREVASDVVIGKLNPNGTLAWYRRYPGTGGQKAEVGVSISQLSGNEIGICGVTIGNFLEDHGGGRVGSSTSSGGNGDIFLLKVDKTNGNLIAGLHYGNITLGSLRSSNIEGCGSLIKEGNWITLFGTTQSQLFGPSGTKFMTRKDVTSFIDLLK